MNETFPSPSFVECPYPHFREALSDAPVRHDPDRGIYIVYAHEDVVAVLRDRDTFVGVAGPISYGGVPMISAATGAEHGAMRSLALAPFLPKRLATYEPMILTTTDWLIDRFIDDGAVDLVDQFAIPLPAHVICELMGLPTSGTDFEMIIDRMSLRGSDRPGESDQGGLRPDDVVRAKRMKEVHAMMRRAFEERIASPSDDILSELVRLQRDRQGDVDLACLVTIGTELLAGGILTTAQMIANAMMLLLDDRRRLKQVVADPSLIPAMLDEALRLESPVQIRERIATRDATLRGVTIPAGSPVLVVLASANRDPARFPHAEAYDLERPRADQLAHVAFGFGEHYCLGAPLSLLEGRVAFERILERLKDIRPADDYDISHIANTHFRAVRHQSLLFDVGAAGPVPERHPSPT